MNTPLELTRTVRGQPVLVLMGAVLADDGLRAPSGVALVPIRAGTHVQYQKQKYLCPDLPLGTNRPADGITLQKVTR